MLRRCVRRLQMPPGMGGGNFGNMLQQMQQQQQQGGSGGCPGGACGANVDMAQMQQQMASMMNNGQLQETIRNAMQNMGQGGGDGPKMGMMAFGVGENEKGKKVARAAKVVVDPTTGKVEKDFREQQLEDDDPVLPKETVNDYSTDGAIEVELTEGTLPREEARNSATASSAHVPEVEVIEVERVPRS